MATRAAGIDRIALAKVVHRARFPKGSEPTPWGNLGTSQRAYCLRIADGVLAELGMA